MLTSQPLWSQTTPKHKNTNLANISTSAKLQNELNATAIVQSGSFNEGQIALQAENADVTINQIGTASGYYDGQGSIANDVMLTEFNFGSFQAGNLAVQEIYGSSMKARAVSITQNGNGNYALQAIQFGSASTTQVGNGNFAQLTQSGDTDSNPAQAMISQNGNHHFVAVELEGSGAVLNVSQSGGNGNRLVGLLSRGEDYSFTGYSVAQLKGGSQLDLMQIGSYNILMIGQNAGTAVVQQQGQYNTAIINQSVR